MNPHIRRAERGFSLVEALVAVLVFSIGLLGAGALVTTAVRNSNNAYLRSQASFLADSVVERLRANPAGVWGGHYNVTLESGKPALPACGTGSGSGCTPAQVATRDRRALGDLIAQQLPEGTGTVSCTVSGAAPVRNYGIAPLDGSCTVRVTWREQRDVDRGGYGGEQSFELVVQP